jgi:hypothetical protein
MAADTASILAGVAGLALVSTTFWRGLFGRRLERELRRTTTAPVRS